MNNKKKSTITQDKVVTWGGNLLLILLTVLIVVPVAYILLCSIMDSVCAEQRWRFLECEELDAGRLSKSFSGSEYMERLPEFLFLFHRFYGYFGDGDSADGISHVTE